MRLATDEFIRRFLIHVLPHGFHRIRHCGFLASAGHKDKVAQTRELLGTSKSAETSDDGAAPPDTLRAPCPDCGGPMRIVEIFRRGEIPRSRAPPRTHAA